VVFGAKIEKHGKGELREMLKDNDAEVSALTQKEREILDFIGAYWEKNNVSPSYREIGAGVGLRSVSSVNRYVRSLTNKGEILPHDGKMRCLVLKKSS